MVIEYIAFARAGVDAAKKFSRECSKNMQHFYDTFLVGNGCVTDLNYAGSWSFIQEGLNSLNAHTNLNLLIERLQSEAASVRGEIK